MSRTRTPRDMPAQDPIDRLDAANARLRQVASDLYSADLDDVPTGKIEVHVHATQPSQPDGRVSELPPTPMRSSRAGVLAGVGGLVSALLALAKALGWLG